MISFHKNNENATDYLYIPGIISLNGYSISGDVYAWTAVFILPLNSALNPFLYTLSAIIGKKVPIL
jgi:hypothetical protein